MFLTVDGTLAQQRKARNLERFVEAVATRINLYDHAIAALYDCAVMGKGFVRFFAEDDEISCERVHPDDVWIDEQVCRNGRPRAFHIKRLVPKEVLRAFYVDGNDDASEIEDAIERAHGVTSGEFDTDLIEVWEGWHLRSRKRAKDGRHVVVMDGAVLVDEEYAHDSFPILELNWSRVTVGFWPSGLAEEIEGLQEEINDLLARIQEAMRLLSAPYILKNQNTDVVLDEWTNEVARIVTYSNGPPPEVKINATVHPEMFQHGENLYRKGFEIAGVSQMSATSTKPAGDLSGRALQVLIDVESVRFGMLSRAWEHFQIEAAERIVKLAKDLYTGETKVKWSSKNLVRVIRWADVNIEEDAYVIRVDAANALPVEPGGRLAFVEQLRAAGGLTPEQVKDLLDFPDLERFMSLERAGRDAVETMLEAMMDSGEYEPPLEYYDLKYGLVRCLQLWSKAKAQGAKDAELQFLVDWMKAAADLLNEQEHGRGPLAQSDGAPPPGPMPPEGAPMPPGAGPPPGAVMPPEGFPGPPGATA
jgi:hypothetical protein